jgi:hypothetical protein
LRSFAQFAGALALLLPVTSAAIEIRWQKRQNSSPLNFQACMASDEATGRVYLYAGTGLYQWVVDDWALAETAIYRVLCAATFDSKRGEFQVYGGSTGAPSYTVLGDFWTWHPDSTSPVDQGDFTPRKQAALVYDRARDVTIVFGGTAQDGTPISGYSEWRDGWTVPTEAKPSPGEPRPR